MQEKDKQDIRIYDNLRNINNIITVLSGKGGVGKSTIAVNLAHTLAMGGHEVGIMDIDIHGPNVPKMLGIENALFTGDEGAVKPVKVMPHLSAASIAFVGYDPAEALVWRGPMKIGLIRQFLGDVVWGSLDYLIIDTPPGTGDEALTTAQLIPHMKGVIIVTSPQDVSILDSRKSITFAKRLKLPILGLVENMSGYHCPHCGKASDIFKRGGGEKVAAETGVPFLGSVPIDPQIVTAGDSGLPVLTEFSSQLASTAFQTIISNTMNKIKQNSDAGMYTDTMPEDPRKKIKNDQEKKTNFRPIQ